MSDAQPKPLSSVQLVTLNGSLLTAFLTDRDQFPPVTTWDRDRIFIIASVAGNSAVYVEIDPWRISGATIDKPRPKQTRKRTATVLPFPSKGGPA